MDSQWPYHDIPRAGMGGTYHDWLRYQQKEERREEKQAQALRTASNRVRSAKAAKTRRKHTRRNQHRQALNGLLVAAVAAGLLVAGAALKVVKRTGL